VFVVANNSRERTTHCGGVRLADSCKVAGGAISYHKQNIVNDVLDEKRVCKDERYIEMRSV